MNKYIRTRGAIALIDDHESFLDVLRMGFPSDRHVVTTSDPIEAITLLVNSNERLLREEAELANIFANEDPVATLRAALEWIRDEDRLRSIETVFIDYNMPRMDGLELLRHIEQARLMRVLLTGQATTDEAVQAFNQGLIDMYVSKSEEGLGQHLRELAARGPSRDTNVLWRRLNPVLARAIASQTTWGRIADIMTTNGVVEFIMLPSPTGYLCRSSKGRLGWLQLDTVETIHGLVEVLIDHGWPRDLLADIAAQRTSVPIELVDALGEPPSAARAEPIRTVSDEPWIGAAYFPI